MHRLYYSLISFIFIIGFISCDEDSDYYTPEETNLEIIEIENDFNVKISKYMNQASGGVSVQGADCYGDYLFQFQHTNAAVFIYNMRTKKYVGKTDLKPISQNHCNNVSFSRIFYEQGDEFPLLYTSGSQSRTYNHVQVYRITRVGHSFFFDQIQDIILPQASPYNGLYWTNVTFDSDNNMYVASSNSGQRIISRFRVPDYSPFHVELIDDNILDSFEICSFEHHQGASINNHFLYILAGVPSWGDTNFLIIVDLEKQQSVAKINLMKYGLKAEPEGTFFYDGSLYCATNNSGIYRIDF